MSTYTPIASQTLGSAAASVTFSSIPQGYTDLVLVTSTKTTSASADGAIVCTVNGDTGSNYSATALYGTGSSALSFRSTAQVKMYFGRWSNSQYTTSKTQFNNYSNSTTYKTVLSQGGNTTNYIFEWVNLWRSASAITSMELRVDDTSNFDAGSTFSLYGIQVGQAAQKAQGGNIVVNSGGYIYHAYTSSGTFIPNESLTADVLVIAGGGGGGSGHGGGGGAGGYRSFTSQSLTAKTYPVIVGAGGAGAAFGGNAKGVSGSNSVFNSNSSTGGGGGGSRYDASGASGGSGGGAGYQGNGGSGNAGSYSPVEGYAGGGGQGGTGGSGGGGAGGVGTTDTDGATGEVGGAGSNAHSTWASATNTGVSGYYAGGGGGGANGDFNNGAGGAGGGGGGGYLTAGVSATPNTGSGGGGGPATAGIGQQTGGNGSGGIVIIRYAV